IPVALVGHTRNHAWGLTMFEDDDSDFFIERFAISDSSATVYKDSLEAKVAKYTETVKVKGGGDTTFTVYETVNGVLINHHLPIKSDIPISMYWNYTALENELLEAFYQMNRADNLKDFEIGVEMIASPGLNVNYGDASGNIAHWSASKLIMRSDSSDGKLYGKGYASGWNFKDYYGFDANPKIINPDRDFVHSANQMHDTTEGILYPGYYAPDSRSNRIEELLEDHSNATVESVQKLMLDNVSETEADVAHLLVRIIRNSGAVFTDIEETALEELEVWRGSHDLSDVEPTIYYKLLYYTLKHTMQDEVGNEVFEKLFTTHLLKRSYPKIFQELESPWWDDVKTEAKIESRESIVLKSFQKSVMELEDELGTDVQSWTWDRVHILEHPHVFSAVSVLKEFFHIGPFPAPGGNETVNNAGFILNGNGEYIAHYGPAMRIVIDFADIENATSILPTGNSGNVMSPHYSDQAEMYVNGEFRKMKMNKKEIETSNNHLVLSPLNKEK
ncbi:MAG: penicillin acylase family protein, partial [Bacteroidota bacterium]